MLSLSDMESLFDKIYENTQPLRKYEPLVRFDQDGNPYPRRPLNQSSQMTTQPIALAKTEPKSEQDKIDVPSKSVGPTNDLKRPPPISSQPEPAKKKQVPGKQQKLTQFFMKK